MNINKIAIELLEKNQDKEAFNLFKTAVKVSRDVQSLTNLAWVYCNEKHQYLKALNLLEEAVSLNPSSHFPYSLLGEVYLRFEHWDPASQVLNKSIMISPSKTSYNNLGIALYHLGDLKNASHYFLLAAEPSDWAMYSHVKCLIDLGNLEEAKLKLDSFSENDDEFVGAVDIADLYVEIHCFKEAVTWFEKGWNRYARDTIWISRYIYSLVKLNHTQHAEELLQEVIDKIVKEIQDAHEEECDESWTEEDKQEHIKILLKEKSEFEQMFGRILSGYVPLLDFDPLIQTACYLFGCNRHNHPDYE